MVNSVGSNIVQNCAFKQVQYPNSVQNNRSYTISQRDLFEPTNGNRIPVAPKIGTFRLATGFLTDKQVAEINRTGQLPSNAKFVMNGYGGYQISNNFFGLRVGTQTLPQGFEVKKNIIGQAIVLPKGSDGLLIK